MIEISRSDFCNMIATIMAGILANPANAQMAVDGYSIQNLTQSIGNAISQSFVVAD